MSKPDVTVKLWAENTGVAFVTVKLSAQSASDIREVLRQIWMGIANTEESLDHNAYEELIRQLEALNLPESNRR